MNERMKEKKYIFSLLGEALASVSASVFACNIRNVDHCDAERPAMSMGMETTEN